MFGSVSAELYKALSDATRRAILDELVDRNGQTLFEICSRLIMKHGISSTRQAISQHLSVVTRPASSRTERCWPCHNRTTRAPQAPPPGHDSLGGDPETMAAPNKRQEYDMRISLTSVFVDDQAKALAFYTNVLGFQ